MRVMLSTYGPCRDVQAMLGLAVAEVPLFAPPRFAELLAGVSVPLVPIGAWR